MCKKCAKNVQVSFGTLPDQKSMDVSSKTILFTKSDEFVKKTTHFRVPDQKTMDVSAKTILFHTNVGFLKETIHFQQKTL